MDRHVGNVTCRRLPSLSLSLSFYILQIHTPLTLSLSLILHPTRTHTHRHPLHSFIHPTTYTHTPNSLSLSQAKRDPQLLEPKKREGGGSWQSWRSQRSLQSRQSWQSGPFRLIIKISDALFNNFKDFLQQSNKNMTFQRLIVTGLEVKSVFVQFTAI